MTRRAAATLLVSLAVAGCAGRSTASLPAYPGHLRPPIEVRPDFMLRQHLQARYGDEEFEFDVVLQKRGDELVLLGLAPYGGKAFALTQRGTTFEAESFVPMRLPFPPRHILNDIHRVFLRGSGLDDRRPDGRHESEEHGERLLEVWHDARLVVRTFERLDGDPDGRIRIDYQGPTPAGGLTSPRILLRNEWFDYELRITNLEQHRL
jgi:hypothetical protein